MDVVYAFVIIAVVGVACAACVTVFVVTRELVTERYKTLLKEQALYAAMDLWDARHPDEGPTGFLDELEKESGKGDDKEKDPNVEAYRNGGEDELLDAAYAIMQEVHDVVYEAPEVDEDGGTR